MGRAAGESGLVNKSESDHLSTTLESALEREIAEVKRRAWREANRQAVEVYNGHVEKHGTFSDNVRSF